PVTPAAVVCGMAPSPIALIEPVRWHAVPLSINVLATSTVGTRLNADFIRDGFIGGFGALGALGARGALGALGAFGAFGGFGLSGGFGGTSALGVFGDKVVVRGIRSPTPRDTRASDIESLRARS